MISSRARRLASFSIKAFYPSVKNRHFLPVHHAQSIAKIRFPEGQALCPYQVAACTEKSATVTSITYELDLRSLGRRFRSLQMAIQIALNRPPRSRPEPIRILIDRRFQSRSKASKTAIVESSSSVNGNARIRSSPQCHFRAVFPGIALRPTHLCRSLWTDGGSDERKPG